MDKYAVREGKTHVDPFFPGVRECWWGVIQLILQCLKISF